MSNLRNYQVLNSLEHTQAYYLSSFELTGTQTHLGLDECCLFFFNSNKWLWVVFPISCGYVINDSLTMPGHGIRASEVVWHSPFYSRRDELSPWKVKQNHAFYFFAPIPFPHLGIEITRSHLFSTVFNTSFFADPSPRYSWTSSLLVWNHEQSVIAGRTRCKIWTEVQTQRWHGWVCFRSLFAYQLQDCNYGTWRPFSRKRSSFKLFKLVSLFAIITESAFFSVD